jgi:hypothetical protein
MPPAVLPDTDDTLALWAALCGTPRGWRKRVNADQDEIWVCDTCPAVCLRTTPAQLHTLTAVLGAEAWGVDV